jgi:arylsulfatase/uncharacterized sulfatase
LKAQGQYDNTIFVITSDNGPEPNRGDNDWRLAVWMSLNGYHVNREGMGQQGSWGFIGPEWATAAASPGALYKFYVTEGGIRAPLIISGPGVEPSKIHSPAMVTDIAPTLLDWIDALPAPNTARPITGRSLVPVLKGQTDSVYKPDDVRAIEVSGNSALYKGDYKITRSMPPVGDGKWRLFDMARDPGETIDVSALRPKVFQELLADYAAYSARYGVLEMPEGYDSQRAVQRNSMTRFLQHNRGILILLGLVLLAALYALWRAVLALWRGARA